MPISLTTGGASWSEVREIGDGSLEHGQIAHNRFFVFGLLPPKPSHVVA
jgi:hypothetical protein